MKTLIKTERLTLRRAHPDDLEAMHLLVSDFEVSKMTASWPSPPDRGFTATRCQPMDPAKGMAGPVFAGGEMVGMMGVHDDPKGPGLGYAFRRDHWGKGYATEIGRALIAHTWATYDWPSLRGCVFDDNAGSSRVLEKLGFKFSEQSEGPCKARGGPQSMRIYHLHRPKA